ncbi:ABC transporter permease [Actinoplanes lobatus]|uniref:ABC transporter permease n=1 Tax=Actinoplanes lobatus TaxID=113568 RepID=A0A7W7HKB1_9ACTN|nr:iron chelate uptake ABC transporter family permease subunit [Actinoplanes lobatus]MBB4752065.1 iron complex transport system permease protein [Actinoplanes lobatus]GGN98196.1 ABC transporter permease [Actinoplanes lobatus]GIE45891.1 ABC transporter permease [Actinoplanes lobatus]
MTRRLTVRAPGIALRLDVRTLGVSGALLVAAFAAVLLTVVAVGIRLPLADIVEILQGGGRRADRFILLDLRLPRVCLALLTGAALALSGAVFQSLSRNPLGSPDIVGFTTGSATGAVLAIVVFGAGPAGSAVAAIAGGIGTALIVYGLAARGGGSIRRLVLVGIGIAAMLVAVNSYLISRARLDAAQSAAVWLVGTLNGRTWQYVYLLGIALAVLTPPLLLLSRRLQMLAMGEDSARSLGVPVRWSRLSLMVLAVAVCAVATAATGPVAFVALAAPQVTRRLTRSPSVQLLPAAITGALLMVLSDFVAQRILAPAQLPVGVVTGAVGGVYLAWLLSEQWRKGNG